jgi:DNA invertase Pin-like site-specific DNA recombinase
MYDNQSTNGLRFAAMPRVSTERQEKKGESLRTQRTQIEQAVKALGGTVVAWYGGQEHATAGWERQQRDQMLADAEDNNKPFDAIMVAHEDRWSRDDTRSGPDLDRLMRAGVRFFVLTREQDLYDPTVRLYLGMSAVIGAYHARNQKKKSLENRIERAKQGRPSCGTLPFGRRYNKATNTWSVIPEKQALLQDVARRYLVGEPMRSLAVEYGSNPGHLREVLRTQAGTTWRQRFRSKALNIDETVETPVPPLLDDDTIQAVRGRAKANTTYLHGQTKYSYLLGRVVFCAHCGTAYRGQMNTCSNNRYYRHGDFRAAKECPHRHPRVNADEIEQAVLRQLFDLFGNPSAVQKAAEAATVNADELRGLRERQKRLQARLDQVECARDRVVDCVADGTFTKARAKAKLAELATQEETLKAELTKLGAELENSYTPEEIQVVADRASRGFRRRYPTSALQWARNRALNDDFAGMTWSEARELVQLVFAGNTSDGRRMGVYVELPEGHTRRFHKRWRFHLRGRLVENWGVSPHAPFVPTDPEETEFSGGPLQRGLLGPAGGECSHKSRPACAGQATPRDAPGLNYLSLSFEGCLSPPGGSGLPPP